MEIPTSTKQQIAQMTEMVFKFYPLVRRSFRSLVSIKDLPISTTQLSCLYTVEQQGEITMSELASKMQVSNQQLTKIVDNIVDLDLVTREIDPENRRKLKVCITKKGAKTLEKLRMETVNKLSILCMLMPEDEVEKIYKSVMHLEKYLSKMTIALDANKTE